MENQDITIFAKTNFRNGEARFGIKLDDRRRHMYIIGKTGMGKSQMIENMIIQDIQNGKGVAVVDPHGDMVERILLFVPRSRINDVVYFNPSDMDHPISFNILEQVSDEQKHLVVSGMIGVFKKIWADSWGPRLEYVLHHSISALLDYPGSTLLGIMKMLVDKSYRNRVVEKVRDPVVKSFWVDEYSKYPDRFQSEAIAPIQNKVGRFLSSALIRNIIGQVQSTINMRDIMDTGKIFLINLSKGRVGEDNSALLGALLITKLQLAAMSRVDVPESERRDFYLYVDEFQNFATESFANILSEARKYRLNLIIAHQYIAQLASDNNTVVRDAVFGNVGTIISFRVGAADAEYLEMEFAPEYTQEHLVNLPKFHIYLKLMIDGVTSNAFSASTLPPFEIPKDGYEIQEKIIKASRERYTSNRVEVEDKITRWSEAQSRMANEEHKAVSAAGQDQGVHIKANKWPKKSSATTSKAPVAKKPAATKGNGQFSAICDNCGNDILLSFEPRKDKPIYCRDCLNLPKDQRKPFIPVIEKNEPPKEISLEQALGKKVFPAATEIPEEDREFKPLDLGVGQVIQPGDKVTFDD